jgi:hypothetical protein
MDPTPFFGSYTHQVRRASQIAAMALRVAIHANDAVAERHKVNDSYDSAVGSPIPGENNSWDGVLTSIL